MTLPIVFINPYIGDSMKLKLMEGKALAKLIGSIGTARVQLDEQVQMACLQVIAQSVLHRNTTPANSLLDAVSKHHKATVVAYLEKFGNFAWDGKAEKLNFREVHAASNEALEGALEAIGEAKWYDARKAPKPVSQYDAFVVIDGFFDLTAKKFAKEGITVENREAFDRLRGEYRRIAGEMYDKANPADAEKRAVEQALEARASGKATPAQLKALAEHFAREVTQVEDPNHRSREAAAEGKQLRHDEQFGGKPELATGTDGK